MDAAIDAGRVTAGHDRRGGIAERARHDLHGALAGLQIVEAGLADLHELLDERVVAPDQDRARLVRRAP